MSLTCSSGLSSARTRHTCNSSSQLSDHCGQQIIAPTGFPSMRPRRSHKELTIPVTAIPAKVDIFNIMTIVIIYIIRLAAIVSKISDLILNLYLDEKDAMEIENILFHSRGL